MAQYELSLRDYIRIIKKRRFVIIFSFIIFAAASFFYTSSRPSIYEASTTVKIEERKTIAGLLTEIVVYNPGDIMETQTKVIEGFPVMKRTALKLNLIDKDAPREKVYEVVGELQSKIRTERVGNTNIIKIIARARSAQEAMELANTVAASYIEENLLEKNKQARTARKFIEEQLYSLEQRLRSAEDKLKNLDKEVKNINIAPDVQQKLVQLTFELASLKQKYTEKHPKILQLKEQIKQLESQLKGFSGKELDYARLKREVEVNKKIYAMLREKLEEVRIREAEKVPDVSIVDPALLPTSPINTQSKITVAMGSLLGIVLGMVLAFVAENLDTSMGTIEDVENSLKLPVLGVVPSITYGEHKRVSFFSRFKKEKKDEAKIRYIRLISHYRPTDPTAESFRSIKTNIMVSQSRKVILITSAGPQEGKTTILINLGIVFAQEGLKTVLVSSDLRRPAIAESFGLDRKPGLSDLVRGTVSLEDTIRSTVDMILGDVDIDNITSHPGLDHIKIIPAGSSSLNPTEILHSKEVDAILSRLKKEFDVVLLDAPPVLPVADVSVLAPRVDGVVLCYEIGRTSRHALIRAKIQLEAVGAKILGVVLNHTKPQTEALEVYPYYYKYKYYHSKEEKENIEK